MSREYAQIRVRFSNGLGNEAEGLYKISDVGRTKSTKRFEYGFLVQTWRQLLNREETKIGLAIHVVRIPSNTEHFTFDNAIALCFWLDPTLRYRFLVLDQLSCEHFEPSRRTVEYARGAQEWWRNGVAPVIGSLVDSIITS